MIETALVQLLWVGPVWPLLLAVAASFPRTRPMALSLLPWAALPALATVLMPANELQLDGVMLGAGLALDATGRVFLLLLAVLWLATGLIARPRLRAADSHALPVLLLLAMAGSLAMALADDALLFFAAATLAGYALYGVLMVAANAPARHAGTVLLVLLVISDLLVFEVLLLLGHTAAGFDFATLHEAFLNAGNRGLLLGLLVAGFGIKFGLLGFHFWLAPVFLTAGVAFGPALVAYLFGAGLLGGLRLLPLGEFEAPIAAANLCWLGWLTLAYALLVGALQSHPRSILGYAALALGGLWVLLLSIFLDQPSLWQLSAKFLAAMVLQSGFAIAVLLLLATANDLRWQGALRWLAVLLLALAPVGVATFIPDPMAAAPIYAAMAVIAFLAASSALRNTSAALEPGNQGLPSAATQATVLWVALALTIAALAAAGQQLAGASLVEMASAAALVLLAMLLAMASAKFAIARLPSIPAGDVLYLILPGLAWARRASQHLLDTTVARWPGKAKALVAHLWTGVSRIPLGQWEALLSRWPTALTLLILLGLLLVWMGI